MASSISSQQYTAQAQELVDELCKINQRALEQRDKPSFEQFAPIYRSYLNAMPRLKELNTYKLTAQNGSKFREALSDCYLIGKAIEETSTEIFDKFVKIIYADSQSLLKNNTPLELSKKCESLLQRIDTFKTLQPQVETHPKISLVLKSIKQIQGNLPSSSPSCSSSSSSSSVSTPLNSSRIPSITMDECIQRLPAITKELLDLKEALDVEINKTDLNYFAPIAIAFQDAVNRGNGLMRIPFLDTEFARVQGDCLDAFKPINIIVNNRINHFIGKIGRQAANLLKQQITQGTLVDLHERLNRDIKTLLKVRQSLINNKVISDTMTLLNQIKNKRAISEKQDAFSSSSSSSNSTAFSSSNASALCSSSASFLSTSGSLFTPSSCSLNPRIFGDIFISDDHKHDPIPSAKRDLFPHSNTSLSIVIPSNDQGYIKISSTTAPQNKSKGLENAQDLEEAIEQSEEEVVDEDLLKAIQLSIELQQSNNESVKGKDTE